MPIPQFDFSKGPYQSAPPDTLPPGTLRAARNTIIDDDGTPLAMPWYLTRCKENLTTGFGPTRHIRRSDVPVWHVVPGAPPAITIHPPGYNWRLTSMESVNSAYMYNDARNAAEQVLTTTQTFNGGVSTLVGQGLSTMVQYAGNQGGLPKQFVAVHGLYGAVADPNAFFISQLEYQSPTIAPIPLSTNPVGAGTTPIGTAQGYVVGAKFPKKLLIYRGRMAALGDHDIKALMGNLVMLSNSGSFSDIAGNPGIPTGADAWGGSNGNNLAVDGFIVGGENVTGAVFADSLWICNTRGILRFNGNIPGQALVDPFEIGNGCVSAGSVQVYKGTMIYLSPEGFMLMGPSGEAQSISDGIKAKTLAMIAAQRIRGASGAFDQDGGSSFIVGNRYCILWPNDNELWTFDFSRGAWSFHDARAAFDATGAEPMPRPFLIGGSRGGRLPTVQYIRDKATTKKLHTKRIEPIEMTTTGLDGAGGYKGEFDTAADDMMWRNDFHIELAPIGGEDRVPKRPSALLLDIETDAINAYEGVLGTFSVEIVNESNLTLARGYVSPGNTPDSEPTNRYAGRRLRVIVPIAAQALYTPIVRVKIFKGDTTMNRATSAAFATAPCPMFRLFAAKWIFDGEDDAINEDSAKQFTPMSATLGGDNALYVERYSTIGPDIFGGGIKQSLLVRSPWQPKNSPTSVWVQPLLGITPYVIPSTPDIVCGSFLSAPTLEGYHLWEMEYTVLDTAVPAVLWFIGLNLVNEGEDVDVSSTLNPVSSPEAPLTIFIQPTGLGSGSLPKMTARWYTGGLAPYVGAFSTREITLTATAADFYGRTHRFRVTRVPKTGQFWIDHSIVSPTVGTDGTFAPVRTAANRIEASIYTRAAQTPLNPYVTGRADGVVADHLRWGGIDVFPLNVRGG